MRDHDLVLLLLDDDPRLLKLVAVWDRVAASATGREARLKRWATLSGVPLTEVRRLAPILWENDICDQERGTVADQALAVVRAWVAGRLELGGGNGARGGTRRRPV